MFLALRLERELSKDEILYLYLNQIYLGDGNYGMQRLVVSDPMGHLLAFFASIAMVFTLVYAQPYIAEREIDAPLVTDCTERDRDEGRARQGLDQRIAHRDRRSAAAAAPAQQQLHRGRRGQQPQGRDRPHADHPE